MRQMGGIVTAKIPLQPNRHQFFQKLSVLINNHQAQGA
jgi:hypothetical protein